MSYIPFHTERMRRHHALAELTGLLAGAAVILVASCCREPNVPGPLDASTDTALEDAAFVDQDVEFPNFAPDAAVEDAAVAVLEPAEGGTLMEAGTSPCDKMYIVLKRYSCKETETIRPAGEKPETFVQLCKRAIATGHPMPTSCVISAKSRLAVQRCGVLCDAPSTSAH